MSVIVVSRNAASAKTKSLQNQLTLAICLQVNYRSNSSIFLFYHTKFLSYAATLIKMLIVGYVLRFYLTCSNYLYCTWICGFGAHHAQNFSLSPLRPLDPLPVTRGQYDHAFPTDQTRKVRSVTLYARSLYIGLTRGKWASNAWQANLASNVARLFACLMLAYCNLSGLLAFCFRHITNNYYIFSVLSIWIFLVYFYQSYACIISMVEMYSSDALLHFCATYTGGINSIIRVRQKGKIWEHRFCCS